MCTELKQIHYSSPTPSRKFAKAGDLALSQEEHCLLAREKDANNWQLRTSLQFGNSVPNREREVGGLHIPFRLLRHLHIPFYPAIYRQMSQLR